MTESSQRRDLWPAAASAALALLLYSVTLCGTFVYDDLYVTRDDPRLADPAYWRYYWTEQYFLDAVDKLYRPLTSMTYAVQVWLHGQWAFPFHLVNWLLMGACTAAVAEFARRIAGTRVAWTAGLLFAVHPIHVEVVAGIVGRAELLCTLSMLGGLLIYLGGPLSGRRIVAIVACAIAAVLTKEQGLLFPLLLAMTAWLTRRRPTDLTPPATPPATAELQLAAAILNPVAVDETGAKSASANTLDYRPKRIRREPMSPAKRLHLILAICLVYLFSGYMFFRESMLSMTWDRSQLEWSINPMVGSDGIDRWLMPLVILGKYAQLLVWPATLSVDYGGEVLGSSVRWNEPWIYIGMIVAVGGISLIARSLRRRDGAVALCLIAAGLFYGMVSNLPSLIGVILAERLMFLPSVFLSILAGIAFTRWIARRPQAGRVGVALMALLLTLGAVRTVTYALQWHDPFELFRTALAEQPRSMQLHGLVFEEHLSRGEIDQAYPVARSCVAVAPKYWKSYVLLARAEVERGDVTAARAALQYAKDHCYHDELISGWMRVEVRIEEKFGPATRAVEP